MRAGYLSEVFVSFQGEGAYVGCRHLFVRLAGCNLRCQYCDTPDSLERTSQYVVHHPNRSAEIRSNPAHPVDLARTIDQILRREGPIDAVAVTGGEPLTQSEFVAEVLQVARPPVPVLLETNGVLPKRLPDVLPWVGIISMDIKPPSNTGEGAFWDEHAEFVRLCAGKDLYVKLLVDEQTLDSDVLSAGRLLTSIRPEVTVFIQPIIGADGLVGIRPERLTHLYAVMRRELRSVRVLPQTHKILGIR